MGWPPDKKIGVSLGETSRRCRMSVKIVRALNRGLDVLRIIQESKAASLNDLHLATQLPKATLLRILKTLTGRDLIRQRIGDGAYVPSYTFSKRARVFDEETHLAEVAAPILADLCKRVRWPSILLGPRLDHMVVIETNRPMSDFDYIISPTPLGSFHVNMLRSASGRCYLAFCSPKERAAILARLRKSVRPGDALARSTVKLNKVLADVRVRGYGTRDPDFGGHYDLPKNKVSDGRSSIAVPIHAGDEVVGCINLTWITKVATVPAIIERFLPDLNEAAKSISERMIA
jgi:IclR family transcriptional regulator, mhp operon transcriptional activator